VEVVEIIFKYELGCTVDYQIWSITHEHVYQTDIHGDDEMKQLLQARFCSAFLTRILSIRILSCVTEFKHEFVLIWQLARHRKHGDVADFIPDTCADRFRLEW